MRKKIAAISKEFYRVPVTITAGGVAIDPTTLPVKWAIVPFGQVPTVIDFMPGDWEATSATSALARALVGASDSDHPLTKGTLYDAWLQLTDNPERPAKLVGQILAT